MLLQLIMKKYQLNIYGWRNGIDKSWLGISYRYILYDNFKLVKASNSRNEMKMFIDILGLRSTKKLHRHDLELGKTLFQLEYTT